MTARTQDKSLADAIAEKRRQIEAMGLAQWRYRQPPLTWATLLLAFLTGFIYGAISVVLYFLYFAHAWQVPGANG